MTILDMKDFFDFQTRVVVYTKDGDSVTGIITGIENDFETESGVDEIELDIGESFCFAIEIPDIIKVEAIEYKDITKERKRYNASKYHRE